MYMKANWYILYCYSFILFKKLSGEKNYRIQNLQQELKGSTGRH